MAQEEHPQRTAALLVQGRDPHLDHGETTYLSGPSPTMGLLLTDANLMLFTPLLTLKFFSFWFSVGGNINPCQKVEIQLSLIRT